MVSLVLFQNNMYAHKRTSSLMHLSFATTAPTPGHCWDSGGIVVFLPLRCHNREGQMWWVCFPLKTVGNRANGFAQYGVFGGDLAVCLSPQGGDFTRG